MLKTSEILKKYNLITKKSLGQNFILDSNITDKIARCGGDLSEYNVLEIGAGPGGLTQSILKRNPKNLTSLDMDERCVNALNNEIKQDNFQILLQDAMQFDENLLEGKIKIIANLPYNIGTPLLIKWLHNFKKFQSITILLQKEVVNRICAKPNTKEYGRISILSQYLCDVKREFDIPASAFTPAPKVTSTLVTLYPKQDLQINFPIKKLETITQALFSQRRKKIGKMLSSISKNFTEEELRKINISIHSRPENLEISDFINLAVLFNL